MLDVAFVSYWVAVKVVGLQVLTGALVVLFFARHNPSFQKYAYFVTRWGLWVGFLVALGAALGAQWFEWMGLLPCYLCWWGRIFLYPQIVLLGIAAWSRHAGIALYSIALSVLGAGVSFYHHALQMGWVTTQPCVAEGGVDCAQRLFFEFGYVTFPLMSTTVFMFLIVIMLHIHSSRSHIEMSPAP